METPTRTEFPWPAVVGAETGTGHETPVIAAQTKEVHDVKGKSTAIHFLFLDAMISRVTYGASERVGCCGQQRVLISAHEAARPQCHAVLNARFSCKSRSSGVKNTGGCSLICQARQGLPLPSH